MKGQSFIRFFQRLLFIGVCLKNTTRMKDWFHGQGLVLDYLIVV